MKKSVGLIVCVLLIALACCGCSGASKTKNGTLEDALDTYVRANFTGDAKAQAGLLPKDYFEKGVLEEYGTEGKFEASFKEYLSQYITELTKMDPKWTYSYVIKAEEAMTAEEIAGDAEAFNSFSEKPKEYREGKAVVITFSVTVSGHEMAEEARPLYFISDGAAWYIAPGSWDNLSYDIHRFVKKIS